MRAVIEEYAHRTRFCFLCNNREKLLPALVSRCVSFRFAPLPRALVAARLSVIAASEGCVYRARCPGERAHCATA